MNIQYNTTKYIITASIFIIMTAQGAFSSEAVKQNDSTNLRMLLMDKDKDGKISEKEYKGPKNAFKAMDKNHDGFIDESELHTGDLIKDFDVNGDNKISPEEFPGTANKFKSLDKNNNGFIESTEAKSSKSIKRKTKTTTSD